MGGASRWIREIRSAWRETPVLEKIRLRCVFAVVMEMLKSAAASLIVAPVVRRSITRISAGVRPWVCASTPKSNAADLLPP